MASWRNLLGYQAAWFASSWSAGRGMPWIGIAACGLFIAWQWHASPVRAADARVVLAALACGFLIEGALAASGGMRHASSSPGWFAPAWIVALWGAFAMTLNHSMAWFAKRKAFAALFAGVGGPLAYLGAARGFHAVAFVQPAWHALAFLALAWACALPLLLSIAAGRTRDVARTHA